MTSASLKIFLTLPIGKFERTKIVGSNWFEQNFLYTEENLILTVYLRAENAIELSWDTSLKINP